jgi:hypothetical protein
MGWVQAGREKGWLLFSCLKNEPTAKVDSTNFLRSIRETRVDSEGWRKGEERYDGRRQQERGDHGGEKREMEGGEGIVKNASSVDMYWFPLTWQDLEAERASKQVMYHVVVR